MCLFVQAHDFIDDGTKSVFIALHVWAFGWNEEMVPSAGCPLLGCLEGFASWFATQFRERLFDVSTAVQTNSDHVNYAARLTANCPVSAAAINESGANSVGSAMISLTESATGHTSTSIP